jgi:hypothetical protein
MKNDLNWSFADPPNVLVFASKDVVEDVKWIHYVSHDEDDGAWQFHSIDGPPQSMADARIVSLRNIVALDSTVIALADLPLGWIARRDSKEAEWQRKMR